MAIITTKGGEEKLTFETGAQRGTEDNKPVFDWIKPMKRFKSLKVSMNIGHDPSKKPSEIYLASYLGKEFEIEYTEPIVGKVPFQEQDTSMIPDIMLNRLGGLFWRGAQKYSRDNWKKGMNLARTFSSMFRHMVYWWVGDTSEDHLAAIIWNATVLMWTENEIYEGRLTDRLADCGPMEGWKYDKSS